MAVLSEILHIQVAQALDSWIEDGHYEQQGRKECMCIALDKMTPKVVEDFTIWFNNSPYTFDYTNVETNVKSSFRDVYDEFVNQYKP